MTSFWASGKNRVCRILWRVQGVLCSYKHRLPQVSLSDIISETPEIAEPITEDIYLPPYQGLPSVDDTTPLLEIIASLQPTTVIEFGTAYGNVTANICHQAPEAMVYTVNALSEDITGATITATLDKDDIGRVYRKYGYEDRVHQVYANTLSLNLSEHIKNDLVDLAIIDACHDPKYVINDFHKVRRHIRCGGIVLLHDTDPSMKGHLIGSYLACMRLRKQGFDIQHLDGTWWGVWVKKRPAAYDLGS